jgi:hypothetical protein
MQSKAIEEHAKRALIKKHGVTTGRLVYIGDMGDLEYSTEILMCFNIIEEGHSHDKSTVTYTFKSNN